MPESKRKLKFTKRDWIFTAILAVTHLIGIVGLSWDVTDEFFLTFFPVHLLLTLALVLISARWNIRFIVFFITAITLIFFAELAAVHTGQLLGRYGFGETLGPQLYQVPLLITAHWFLLIYGAGVLTRLFKTNKPVRIITGAFAMVVLDAFVEPVAVAQDMWSWETSGVPMTTYIVRFVFFLILLSLFNFIRFKKKNPVALTLFLLQALFYILLYAIQ